MVGNLSDWPRSRLISERRSATMFFYIRRDGGPYVRMGMPQNQSQRFASPNRGYRSAHNAGAEGWEVIAITPNRIAFLKRQIERPMLTPSRSSSRAKVSQA